MRPAPALAIVASLLLAAFGCSTSAPKKAAESKQEPAPQFFHVDPAAAGVLHGAVRYTGRKPAAKTIDMSSDPACVEAHRGRAVDESLMINSNGTLANVFVYIKEGLEGKQFEVPATPVHFDQHGCWFQPRVLGIQAGQVLSIANSDPVTHNIHPLAQVNREWNHSQGPGDDPIARKFLRPEVMIPVKCNIHSWMRAYIGVVSNPYFAVTGKDGSFTLPNVPPGDYVIEFWQEKLGTEDRKVTVPPKGDVDAGVVFKGE
ncbi:MAG TPA: carboxypeptidase regulatory-like domain-containing protein [Bryobacteraceae bacterium]|jgi:plastocyanin|nr:carboxypeptidase regulatory-like domain-containing protein [Bryobacteraceae bacterium]